MKHTPGPWHVVEGKLTKSALEVHADSRAICELWRRGNAKTELANARLIAAAPDLVEALLEIYNERLRLGAKANEYALIVEDIARKAIAKATAEAPC